MPKTIDFILAVARKILSMRGKGIASIANRSDVESKAGEIAAIFQQAGLPMNRLGEFIKSEKDVTKYLNIIEGSAKSKVKQSIQPKPLMQSSKSGDVIDLKELKGLIEDLRTQIMIDGVGNNIDLWEDLSSRK
jgi:hypothetical protein